jgi:alanyl-tRNA synthetase
MRRIEAVTGVGADALVRDRFDALERIATAVGAQAVDGVPDRIAALQDELRETKRRLKAGVGTGLPKPGELASQASEVAPGVHLVAAAVPYDSMDALKAAARDISVILGSGVVALVLDADEPQLFVTVSEDLVARGISAGDLVTAAMPALDGRGGGRPAMAQGRGTRRDGRADALAAIRSRLETEASGA